MPADQQTTDPPLRVSTLELFFDLVFAFTLTQLSALLDGSHLSAASIAQVLLVFGVLWWMYGGYAWLTNARTPDRTPERLLLLLGMAGFLVVGVAIRNGFGNGRSASSGIFLGLGYLVVVCVHGGLYYRVNRNIVRVLPVNLSSALLVLLAGLTSGVAAYLLWTAALAIQVLSPLVVRVGGRFEIAPAHFAERHGALVIVALGESVAAVGIGAAAHPLDAQIVLAARARPGRVGRAVVGLLRRRGRRAGRRRPWPRRHGCGGPPWHCPRTSTRTSRSCSAWWRWPPG